MAGFECFYAILTDMGHGSQAVGHGSQFRWVTGSWVTLLDPLPALHGAASFQFLPSPMPSCGVCSSRSCIVLKRLKIRP